MNHNFKDLTGQTFGRLTVIEYAGKDKNRNALWRCRCECGNEIITRGSSLRSKHTQTCGCSNFEDLTGQTFGRLTVIKRVENDKHGQARWLCRCSCGKETFVTTQDLKSRNVQSCGCLRDEKLIERCTKHRLCDTSVYHIWAGMIQRCENPNNIGFDRYGGRGIKVCERWHVFENFYDDVSVLPHFGEKGYSLDRENNDKDYEPGNVRWATKKQQNNNQRSNIKVEYEGEMITLAQAAEKSGINYHTLHSRYKKGLRGDKLFAPVKKTGCQNS